MNLAPPTEAEPAPGSLEHYADEYREIQNEIDSLLEEIANLGEDEEPSESLNNYLSRLYDKQSFVAHVIAKLVSD